jgi:3-dehydroquinate dehydratase/shikimate dehydrogenase
MLALRKARLYTRTIELRLDWLRSDGERGKLLAALRRYPGKGLTLIATCRRILGGGNLAGGAEAELYWLGQAREAGCEWCDLEIETLRELPGQTARSIPVPKKILLSFHDFQRTPPLPRRLVRARRGEADAIKIAARALTISDSLRLLRLAHASNDIVSVPMGEIGLPARLLALRGGSALAYAPVSAATAPGQVSLHDFKRLYRADAITRKTKVFGVIGDPVGHSLSPLLHNTGFVAAKCDASYLPFLVENLKEFVQAIPEFALRGFSVTIPHKQSIMKHLAQCEPMAEKIGAVNTAVVGKDGKLRGLNTDYVGVLQALGGQLRLRDSRVLIFGAGGSARAAAFALANAGAEVLICARREAAARELARACGAQAIARKHLSSTCFEAILNATPVGMYPHTGISPLSPRELNCKIVMDLIYRPLRTQLLKIAATRGIRAISGVEMFLAQGFAQWELWMGKAAPEAAMRRAVMAKLRSEEAAQK